MIEKKTSLVPTTRRLIEFLRDVAHVTAWSKGGQSGIDNCEMLCETHNRAKGNR